MAISSDEDARLDIDEKRDTSINWEELRALSLQPGGFGERRTELWPQVLGVRHAEVPPAHTSTDPHRDERQILLDTNRSFVMYPVGETLAHPYGGIVRGISKDYTDSGSKDKDTLQHDLHELLVSIFRRRPRLNYFQGYHDIVSVLFLTLPPEIHFLCVEKLSLHRVRDSMGSTLEPVLGLLRVTKNLLRLADPDFSSNLERTSPLPFYALSNLLTLFSHDMPTLPLIQHVFDYLLCRPPIMVVYLATAVILSKRTEIERLGEGDEDEMLGVSHSILSTLPPISGEESPNVSEAHPSLTHIPDDAEQKEEPEVTMEDIAAAGIPTEEPTTSMSESHPADTDNDPLLMQGSRQSDDDSPDVSSVIQSTVKEEEEKPQLPTRSSTPSSELPQVSMQSPIVLTSFLAQADALYALYPPTHSSLNISSIMGPQSVIYTWSEEFTELPDDDEAEKMVAHPELVVYPQIEEPVSNELDDEESGEWEDDSCDDEKRSGKSKGGWKIKRRSKFSVKMIGIRRRLRLERRSNTTMLAGAVLVLGVAIAVYGVQSRGMHPGAVISGLNNLDGLGESPEWKKVVGWFGGSVVGAMGMSPAQAA